MADLVAIDSVLPHEERLAAYVADRLRQLGLEPDWQEVAPGRPNVGAMVRLGDDPRCLVLSGHSDTVAAARDWETDPFHLTERDGRLHGLGVYNMKAGLACALTAFKALVESPDPGMGRVGLAMCVDQEGHSIGARALLDSAYGRCDAMLHGEHFFGDSDTDYLPVAGTGKVLLEVTFHGRTAHAFRPWQGISAIDDAARLVSVLDRLPLGEDPLMGRASTCVLRIVGGKEPYSVVVPDHCQLLLTRLTVPGETAQSALDDLRRLADGQQLRSTVDIEARPPQYDPYTDDSDAGPYPAFRSAYRDVLGQAPRFAGHAGITDANVFAGEGGIPTVVFGPKGGRHHEAGEYVEAETLEPVARIYAETVVRFFQLA